MTKYIGGPREKQFLLDEFRRIAENPREEEYDLWIIESSSTNDLIGYAGFIPKEVEGKEYIELNYYIDKGKWGNGYGKEIAKGLIEYAFKEKKLDRLIAIIDPQNEPSKSVAHAAGMTHWMDEERSGKIKSIYMITNGETR